MTTAEYKVEESRDYEGLFLLTETVVTDDGKRLPGFKAYFESRGYAVYHAKTMMGNKGDTLADETGVLERVA